MNVEQLWKGHRRPGLVFVLNVGQVSDRDKATGSICLVGCDSKPRWQMSNLYFPLHMQWLLGNRILIAEESRRQPKGGNVPKNLPISERNVDGSVHWAAKVRNELPAFCRRLPNGNTFLCYYSSAMVELTAQATEVTYQASANDDIPHFISGQVIGKNRVLAVCDKPQGKGQCLLQITPSLGQIIHTAKLPRSLDINNRQWTFTGSRKLLCVPGTEVDLPESEKAKDYKKFGLPRRVVLLNSSGTIQWDTGLRGAVNPLDSLANGNALVNCWPRLVEMTGQGKAV